MGWDQIWEDPIEWFLSIPLIAQIIISIVLIAIAVIILVLVIYILRAIFHGLYKLFEWLYKFITGNLNKPKKIPPHPARVQIVPDSSPSNAFEVSSQAIPYYCTECGEKITDSLRELLLSGGTAFCFHCGKEFKLKISEKSHI